MSDIDWERGTITPPEGISSNSEPDWEKGDIKPPVEPKGFLGAVRDTAVAGAAGAVTGVQLLANAAGADSAVAQKLGDAADYVRGFETVERREERADRAAKIKAAEATGSTWEEIKANVGAFGEAPIDTTVEALGTSLPTIAATALTRGKLRAPVAGTVGAAQGAGSVKGAIYDAVEQQHLEAGATPEEARARAAEAQAYTGDNAGQIALGAGLGVAAGTTGVEGAIGRLVGQEAGEVAAQGLVRSTLLGAAKEAPLEAAQGGQERLASNLALQNEGFDTPTWQGVAGQAALEGVAGAAAGGGFGAVEGMHASSPQSAPEAAPAVEELVATQADEAVPVVEPVAEPVSPAAGPLSAGMAPPQVPQQYRAERPYPAKPSEQMGLDPAAGALSDAAATAVDSGATTQLAQQAADQQAAEQEQKDAKAGEQIDTSTGEITRAADDLLAGDPATDLQDQLNFVQQQARATGWDSRLVAERDRLRGELDKLQPSRGRSFADTLDDAAKEDNAVELSRMQTLVDAGRLAPDTANGIVERAIRASQIARDKGVVADYLQEANARAAGESYTNASTIDRFDGEGVGELDVKAARAELDRRDAAEGARLAAGAVPAGVPQAGAADEAGESLEIASAPATAEADTQQAEQAVGDDHAAAEPSDPVEPGADQASDDIKVITAKQIPQMNDAELAQAIDHYGPDHKRTAKLQKEQAKRATQGTENVPQTAQAVEASPQPAQVAGQAPTADAEAAGIAAAGGAAGVEHGARWEAMSRDERQALAEKSGVKPVFVKSLPGAPWGRIGEATRQKLSDAMGADASAEQSPSLEGRDLGEGWAEFHKDSGTVGIARAEMPQIKAEHRGAMVNFLNARGVQHQESTVPASALKPTQAEFSRDKVAKARDFEGGNRSILISQDGHVLDGHHQWLAAREKDEDVKVIRLGAPIRELVSLAHEFPSSTTDASSETAANQPAFEPAGGELAQPASLKEGIAAVREQKTAEAEGEPAKKAEEGGGSKFPLQEAQASYSGISHSGTSRGKADAEEFQTYIDVARDAGMAVASADAQKAAVERAADELRAEYLQQYRRLMSVRAGTYSGFVAGRSGLNSKQANKRNSAYDRAIDTFTAWQKASQDKPRQAALDARTDEQKQADQQAVETARQEKEDRKQNADRTLMRKILSWQKGGEPVAITKTANLAGVNKGKDGYPTSIKLSPTDGSVLADDKFDLAALFREKGMSVPDSKRRVRELVDAVRAEDAAAPADVQDAPASDSKTPLLDAHAGAMELARNGKITPDDFRAAFAQVEAGGEALRAELNSMSKEALLRAGGSFFYHRHKADRKAEVIDALYKVALDEYSLGKSYGPSSYMMTSAGLASHRAARAEALRELVANTDEAALQQFAAEIAEARKEREARKDATRQALENPQTLAEFRSFISHHAERNNESRREAYLRLTPEQRRRYDELEAEGTKDVREQAKAKRRTQVASAGDTTAGEVIATKHTKHGHDLYVVKLEERVSREDYETLNVSAKRMGGSYSSFRGNGAIPGFQFRTREAAEAFRKLVAGDTEEAQELAQARRDAFDDDRSQSAVERLRTMADALNERAEGELSRERKANTARRARMAASAEASANADKALAGTMSNIADAIEAGKAKFLDLVRQKVQVEFMASELRNAKDAQIRAKYPSYADQERHRGAPVDAETVDYSTFPTYGGMRSDLAGIARQMIEVDGLKNLGSRLMKVADDVSDAYMEWAKGNLLRVSHFTRGDQLAEFASREDAERAIRRSGIAGRAVVLPIKRGVNRVVLSPGEAMRQGLWQGDGDKRIDLSGDFGRELVEAVGRRAGSKIALPWQLEGTHAKRKRLEGMGIYTGSEYRAALREFAELQQAMATPDKIKQMERAMIGRRSDGLDFFPTSAAVVDSMLEAAEIEEGMAVLEPSAGMGHIADAIRENTGVEPDVGELSGERRELLEAKGYNLVGSDFMELQPRSGFTYGDVFRHADGTLGVMRGSNGLGGSRVGFMPLDGDGQADARRARWVDRDELEGVEKRGTNSGYDRIVMNPPFSKGRDIEHVMHAFDMLKPGGRLVAIIGEGAFFHSNKAAEGFRSWLDELGATSERLPDNSFMDAALPVNTGVNARLVVIDKPAVEPAADDGDAPLFSRRGGAAGAAGAVLDHDAVKVIVEKVAKSLALGIPVQTHSSEAALFEAAPAIERQAERDDAKGQVHAVYHQGKIHVVTSAFARKDDVELAILDALSHEGQGHYGIRSLHDGDKVAIDAALRELFASIGGVAGVKRLAGKHGFDMSLYIETAAKMKERPAAGYLADELLSHLQGSAATASLSARALAAMQAYLGAIREWLRKHGLTSLAKGTDADIAWLLKRMRTASRRTLAGTDMTARFSRGAQQTSSEAFRRWFGKSQVVGAGGEPLNLYHGTAADFTVFDQARAGSATGHATAALGIFMSSDRRAAQNYAEKAGDGVPGYGRVMDLYASIQNPYLMSVEESQDVESPLEARRLRTRLEQQGYDGIRLKGTPVWIAFNNYQVKSATDNVGTFDEFDPDIRFSRSVVRDIAGRATQEFNRTFSAPGGLSWWHKTVGTMYNLAQRSPHFKPVFEAAQGFIDDVSHYASDAAELAPKLLPKLETWRDIAKSPVEAKDNKAIAAPIFEGTLMWARDESGNPVRVDSLAERAMGLSPEQKADILIKQGKLSESMLPAWRGQGAEQFAKMVDSRYETQALKAGIVWTDAELRSMWQLNDAQVELYREFRDATNRSLDTMARADMLRFGGEDVKALRDRVMDAGDVKEAGLILRDHLAMLADAQPERAMRLLDTAQGISERVERIAQLQAEGYAPLSRFGKYTVDVVGKDGERQYFSLFETKREANLMAEQMKGAFPGSTISQGTLSEEAFKLFAGITPETLELFGNAMGLDSSGDSERDKVFQDYLKLTKTNRSAMKRLIHRQGIAGYSEDVGRVLASFVYSNARQTAAGLNMGDLSASVNAIPQGQGELKDAAVRLADYIKNPQEEAQALRGLLFAQYLGGSVASAFVNMTQPVAVTFPWLSQYGGAKRAAGELSKAAKQMATKGYQYEADLAKALHLAEEDGTVSPQEVHQLMAQASGTGGLRAGDGTRAGDARALASNSLARLSLAWGKMFGAAEEVNRRMTFIAAYRIAKAQGNASPEAFARLAVQETQFIYSKASKMRWGRGAVGATLMTFKTYSIAYLELMGRLWNQGQPGSQERKDGRKAALLMIATLMLLSGAGGLPFAEDAEDLIDGMAQLAGYNFSTQKAKEQFLIDVFGDDIARFIDKGVTGLPGAPLDVSGRLGMGNLIPGTGLLQQRDDHSRDVLEIAGPAGDLIKRMISGAHKVASGDLAGGLLEASPAAVRNLAKGADMASTDMYRDDKGYKVLDSSTLEAALKAIGFQPQSVASIQEANWLGQRSKAFYSLRAQEVRALWAQGVFEKDPSKVQEARDAMADWNAKNPDQQMLIRVPDVMRRVREMAKSKDQRIADTAPRAMRQQLREDFARVRSTIED